MKLNHKILLMPLVTALAFSLFFLFVQRATDKTAQTVDRIQDEFFLSLELGHELERDLLNIRQLLTASVLQVNEDLVFRADSVATSFRATLLECRNVPGMENRLRPMNENFEGFFSLGRGAAMDLIAQGGVNEFLPEDLDVRIDGMNRNFDDLTLELADIVATINQELEDAIERMDVRLARARRIMNLTSALFLAILLVISALVITAIVRPVNRMSRVALAIAGGDLEQELDHRSDDALGELADSIRNMQAALIRDIARREKAEADLIAAQGQIIQSEKMAVLGELVAGLAHELNTPLGTLASSADVVSRSRRIVAEKCREGEDLDQVREDPRFQRALDALAKGVQGMETASGRIGELVAGLKAFSQLDQAEFQQTDLNEGLRNIRGLLDSGLPEGVSLEFDLGEAEPLLGYPAQLNQLFTGLIMHAVGDAAPAGTVWVTSARTADTIQVTVRDTGPGYTPEGLRDLFRPGFQAGADRVRMDWDMITVQSIVDRHGGTLTAESRPGEGTTYVVNLPVKGPGPGEATS